MVGERECTVHVLLPAMNVREVLHFLHGACPQAFQSIVLAGQSVVVLLMCIIAFPQDKDLRQHRRPAYNVFGWCCCLRGHKSLDLYSRVDLVLCSRAAGTCDNPGQARAATTCQAGRAGATVGKQHA